MALTQSGYAQVDPHDPTFDKSYPGSFVGTEARRFHVAADPHAMAPAITVYARLAL